MELNDSKQLDQKVLSQFFPFVRFLNFDEAGKSIEKTI